MTSRKHSGARRPMAVCLAILLTGALGQPAAAQRLQDYVADCGQQAREAGLSGAAMSAFIKQCMAKKQGRDDKNPQGSQSQ